MFRLSLIMLAKASADYELRQTAKTDMGGKYIEASEESDINCVDYCGDEKTCTQSGQCRWVDGTCTSSSTAPPTTSTSISTSKDDSTITETLTSTISSTNPSEPEGEQFSAIWLMNNSQKAVSVDTLKALGKGAKTVYLLCFMGWIDYSGQQKTTCGNGLFKLDVVGANCAAAGVNCKLGITFGGDAAPAGTWSDDRVTDVINHIPQYQNLKYDHFCIDWEHGTISDAKLKDLRDATAAKGITLSFTAVTADLNRAVTMYPSLQHYNAVLPMFYSTGASIEVAGNIASWKSAWGDNLYAGIPTPNKNCTPQGFQNQDNMILDGTVSASTKGMFDSNGELRKFYWDMC